MSKLAKRIKTLKDKIKVKDEKLETLDKLAKSYGPGNLAIDFS